MRRELVIGIALALVVPAFATASHGGGTHWYSSAMEQNPDREPSSATYDTATWMHQASPDLTPKLYFNSEMVWSNGFGMNMQPNLAGGRLGAPVWIYHYARLGVWTDCNGDGYIGSARLADDIYLKAADNGAACTGEHAGVNGQFAKEFRWVGPAAGTASGFLQQLGVTTPDAREIEDNAARVWGDFGVPEASASRTTVLLPFPRDSLRSTHGHLRYLDDITWKAISNNMPIFGIVPDVNNPVTWAVKETWNNSDTASDPGTPIYDACTGTGPTLPSYDLDGNNAGGSVYPTTTQTFRRSGDACGDPNIGGLLIANLETSGSSVSSGKVAPDQTFGFSGPTDQLPAGTGPTYTNLLVPWEDNGGWFGRSIFILLRESRLEPDFRKATLAESYYFTAYAQVGSAHAPLPSGSTANYGQVVQCPVLGPVTSPGGWNCDPNAWRAERSKLSAFWGYFSVLLGQPYSLRDVDCVDGKLSDGKIGEERNLESVFLHMDYPTNGAPTTGDIIQSQANVGYVRCA